MSNFWKWWEQYQIDEESSSTTVPQDAYLAGFEEGKAELEAERDRMLEALEAIADDVEEWEMKLVAMKALEEK